MNRVSPFLRRHISKSIFPVNRASYRLSPITSVYTRHLHQSTPRFNANMSNSPPQHEMAYFPGLVSEERGFKVFRKVLHTGLYSQLVAMEIPVNGEIGDEKHTVDQVLVFTHGNGRAIVSGKEQEVKQGDVVIVPAGTQHQFLNVGKSPLEVVTIYSPAEHASTTVHQTKEEGDAQEETGEDEAPDWSRRSKAENEKLGYVKVP